MGGLNVGEATLSCAVTESVYQRLGITSIPTSTINTVQAKHHSRPLDWIEENKIKIRIE